MIDELLRPKYNNIKFYSHNLAGYDIVFILKTLVEFNSRTDNPSLHYKVFPIMRDEKILKLTLKQNNRSLTLLDSYCLLTSSLAKLAKDFNVKTQKSDFPYNLAVEDRLGFQLKSIMICLMKSTKF